MARTSEVCVRTGKSAAGSVKEGGSRLALPSEREQAASSLGRLLRASFSSTSGSDISKVISHIEVVSR